ncbi:MAG TPA: aminoacyl--tRNA ligase-related protein [Opitutaceae bacterium]
MNVERQRSASRNRNHHWYENGQSAFAGELLELFHGIDALFLSWAGECDAAEYAFPTFLPAASLAKLDYFRSFPHLVTFPVTLDADEDNLSRFAEGEPMDQSGAVNLARLAPVCDVLTPAACYHFYPLFKGDVLDGPRYVTTRATCFRREAEYVPLERQWSFSMREIVCLGTAAEVTAFLDGYRRRISAFFDEIGLGIEWKEATDPFFNAPKNPKYLMQKLDPVKTEMVFQDRLAIGSINFHRNYFGEAFEITRAKEATFSGCVAFGIERWIHAWLTQFGHDAKHWPKLP